MQLGCWCLQFQFVRFILLIGAIDSVDHINCINRIDSGGLNCSALQLNDNSNDPTNSGMNFWGKKGEKFDIAGIYLHLKIFHEVCLRKK